MGKVAGEPDGSRGHPIAWECRLAEIRKGRTTHDRVKGTEGKKGKSLAKKEISSSSWKTLRGTQRVASETVLDEKKKSVRGVGQRKGGRNLPAAGQEYPCVAKRRLPGEPGRRNQVHKRDCAEGHLATRKEGEDRPAFPWPR